MTTEILGKAVYDLSKASAKIAELLLREQTAHMKLRGLCDALIDSHPGTEPWADALEAIEAELNGGAGNES